MSEELAADLSDEIAVDRWRLEGEHSIVWDVAADTNLPHQDNVEMSGRRVSVIATYGADAEGLLHLSREIHWPMLRTEPENVRGWLTTTFGPEAHPVISVNGEPLGAGRLTRVKLCGELFLDEVFDNGITIHRILSPSPDGAEVFEHWLIGIAKGKGAEIEVAPFEQFEAVHGMYGKYVIEAFVDRFHDEQQDRETGIAGKRHSHVFKLGKGAARSVQFSVVYRARISGIKPVPVDANTAQRERRGFLSNLAHSLVLETPDPVLNRAFAFARIRAAESLFETKNGLVHSPGGGRFYGGIWCNDQAEYAGPFFPFMGYDPANQASLNAYRLLAKRMGEDYSENIPSSLEAECEIVIHAGGDRGDAAMVAYGASRFALEMGDREIALELWPAIKWCLEYCRRKTNADGVIESDTDELEGRFPTGKANLSTSSLAYGALISAAQLAHDLGAEGKAEDYSERAEKLEAAIETYFGATVEGFDTYRYYDGNEVLRSWICLPLCMGITNRKAGTIDALFSPRLWTEDGLATEASETTFWDRSTLYALRGVFAAGETERALPYLTAYSRRRLLGEHVPYPVEAWPEGNAAHLSAESALYCRIYTEGLFGITPTGLRSFRIKPSLPAEWPFMRLHGVHLCGAVFHISVERDEQGVGLKVTAPRAEIDVVYTADYADVTLLDAPPETDTSAKKA